MKGLLLSFIFSILFLVGCTSENIKKVDVHEMESFLVTKEDSLVTYTDSEAIRTIVKAFKKAKIEPGIVDMADPEYQVDFGENSYYLWVDERQGTIMDLDDTHTIYSLSEKSSKAVYKIIEEGR